LEFCDTMSSPNRRGVHWMGILGFSEMYNSLQQDPCEIVRKLGGTCTAGYYDVPPLPPGGNYSLGSLNPNQCTCNTVYYSLLAACSVCQGGKFISFSNSASNCGNIGTYLQRYPGIIPNDTAVPHYAYLDLSTDDLFDLARARAAGELWFVISFVDLFETRYRWA